MSGRDFKVEYKGASVSELDQRVKIIERRLDGPHENMHRLPFLDDETPEPAPPDWVNIAAFTVVWGAILVAAALVGLVLYLVASWAL